MLHLNLLIENFCNSVQTILGPSAQAILQKCTTPLDKCVALENLISADAFDPEWTALCQSFLGNIYAGGFDHKHHYDKARNLLEQAINSRELTDYMLAICQCNLAGLYASGHGGPVLKIEAKKLLDRAFNSGALDEEIQENYQDLFDELENIPS
jgi:hypothetical protein